MYHFLVEMNQYCISESLKEKAPEILSVFDVCHWHIIKHAICHWLWHVSFGLAFYWLLFPLIVFHDIILKAVTFNKSKGASLTSVLNFTSPTTVNKLMFWEVWIQGGSYPSKSLSFYFIFHGSQYPPLIFPLCLLFLIIRGVFFLFLNGAVNAWQIINQCF